MAQGGGAGDGGLLAMIVDQDTATGMLLTGVGHVDLRRRSNFLIVDDSEFLSIWGCLCTPRRRIAPDISTDFSHRKHNLNHLNPPAPRPRPPFAETPLATIEDTFKDFTNRDDVSVLLINQSIANTIRHLLDAYTRPVPAILEVPSKDQPYDPTQDSILARVKFMFGEG